MAFWSAKSYRGMDGEDEMTDEDWYKRGHEQAMAMREGGDAFQSSPDEDGEATGGLYNGDYPQSWHDECNRRLDEDEYYEAQVDRDIRDLSRAIND